MKMIIRSVKVNLLPVQNESGGHIWDGLLYVWTCLILSRTENVQDRNIWKPYAVFKVVKETLTI